MNISQHVERAAERFPDKAAILFEDRQITYRQLNAMVNQAANAFRANGFGPGDRIALHLPNIPEFAVCYLAAQKIGAIAVSVSPMLTPGELAYILKDSGALLACTTAALLSNLPLSECEKLRQVMVCEGDGLTECPPFACYNHDFDHRFGSVGTPVENVEVKILDEANNDVPPGTWGEICIKGPGVRQGYWKRPGETAATLRDGWLHSGDTGTMDEIEQFCRENMAAYKVPVEITFIENLPKSPTGKILKRVLRDQEQPAPKNGKS